MSLYNTNEPSMRPPLPDITIEDQITIHVSAEPVIQIAIKVKPETLSYIDQYITQNQSIRINRELISVCKIIILCVIIFIAIIVIVTIS